MSDSHAPQPNKKRSFDFSDILSILGEDRTATPSQEPVQEPAVLSPEPEPEPVVKEPEPQEKRMEPATLEQQKPAAVADPVLPAEPQKQATPPGESIVDRLLSDFADKNAEILRLNNELTQIRYEVREKEQKITTLTSIEAVLDQKEEAIRAKDAVIKDKEESIKDKEATIKDKEASLKDKEAALKEKDALLKEKEALLKEIEAALTAKDNEIKAYEAKVRELETKIDGMAEQLGTLRKFSVRESSHEPFVEPETAPGEKQEIHVQEQMSPGEDDVASIFRRLAEAKVEEPENEESNEPPRKPRSAKMYDL